MLNVKFFKIFDEDTLWIVYVLQSCISFLWAYMPEKLLTQPFAYLKTKYVHLVNDTLIRGEQNVTRADPTDWC